MRNDQGDILICHSVILHYIVELTMQCMAQQNNFADTCSFEKLPVVETPRFVKLVSCESFVKLSLCLFSNFAKRKLKNKLTFVFNKCFVG